MRKVLLAILTIYISCSSFAQGWDTLSTGKLSALADIAILNKDVFIAVGADGVVVRTKDRGKTWSDLNVVSTTNKWESVKFVDENTGFIGGQFEDIYKTIDGGETWTKAYDVASSSSQIWDFDFLDGSNGIAVGRSGEVVLTSDGGNTWTDQFSSAYKFLGVKYFSNDYIYVTGGGQNAIYSGGSWTLEIEPVGYWAVEFISATQGFRVGNGGACQSTIDGGTNWADINLGTTESLVDVLFVNDSTGYIVGNNGAFFTTTDGGVTWSFITIATDNLFSIVEKDNLILISGSDGTVFINESTVTVDSIVISSAPSGNFCPNDTVLLKATGTAGVLDFQWENLTQDISLGVLDSLVVIYSERASYRVFSATGVSDTITLEAKGEDECSTAVDSIVISSIPAGKFCPDDTVLLKATGTAGVLDFQWENVTDGTVLGVDDSLIVVFNEPVSYRVYSSTGASETIILESKEENECVDFLVYTIFSPSNGDAVNNTFWIDGLEAHGPVAISIATRTGALLYESSDYQNDWEAIGVPEGVYYYTVKAPGIKEAGALKIVR